MGGFFTPTLRLFGSSCVLCTTHPKPVANRTPNVYAAEFTKFMRTYQDRVYSTVIRLLGDAAQAEDIAQEVFLRAYRDFDQLRDSATAVGWLKTVATNLSLNHLTRYRKRWRMFSELHRRDEQEDEAAPIDFPVPESVLEGLEADERGQRVEQALKMLPEHRRVPLVLYHFEDMSYEEIAQRLRISLSKVKNDILRGRAALARSLMQS